jgi:hypothetical protein
MSSSSGSNDKINSSSTISRSNTSHQKKSPSNPTDGSLKTTDNKHEREEMDREDPNSTQLSGIIIIITMFNALLCPV